MMQKIDKFDLSNQFFPPPHSAISPHFLHVKCIIVVHSTEVEVVTDLMVVHPEVMVSQNNRQEPPLLSFNETQLSKVNMVKICSYDIPGMPRFVLYCNMVEISI